MVNPLDRSRITKMIKTIIGKNHDFCAGELSILWSEVIAGAAILPSVNLLKKLQLVTDMSRIMK
ncbi:MAG: hypothetical protein A2139_11545 [Desulfobacca sp. RBG_16_60_12]|nr:MAG: hypothetical protein A2139_11545 [Desulfobacca sp. RBG_16_60_12]